MRTLLASSRNTLKYALVSDSHGLSSARTISRRSGGLSFRETFLDESTRKSSTNISTRDLTSTGSLEAACDKEGNCSRSNHAHGRILKCMGRIVMEAEDSYPRNERCGRKRNPLKQMRTWV